MTVLRVLRRELFKSADLFDFPMLIKQNLCAIWKIIINRRSREVVHEIHPRAFNLECCISRTNKVR